MKPELLAPAGDLNRLKIAFEYGADAVYFGGKKFSLRARASNFSLDDIKQATDYAHSRQKKVYVTVNMIPHDSDFIGLKEYLIQLEQIGVDAIICASRAILTLSKQVAPTMEVHISTQQTTTNSEAIKYWSKANADRLVLAREVQYTDLVEICKKTDLPLEVFIHGGMCANYSGRCVISNLLTNRDANRGGCAQSCRWNYHLYHKDELIDQDDFLFSFGSKDLCVVDYLEDILKTNVASLKIEGRMKTAYYIATVVKAYRQLIDEFEKEGKISKECLEENKKLIKRSSNREAFAGFYPGLANRDGQIYNNIVTANQSYVANVLDYKDGLATIEVRNYFKVGDKLRLFNPKGKDEYFVLNEMKDMDDQSVEIANKPMQKLKIKLPTKVNEFTFITKGDD